MKFEDYQDKLQANPEYHQAEKELRFRFQLANAVLRARLKKGLSQADLSEAVGTKQANISRIEAGLANPTLDFIRRICDVLEIDLLFTDREAVSTQAVFPIKRDADTGVDARR